jgi:hypothetical protein
MHIFTSLNGALAADRERTLREKARNASTRQSARRRRAS